MFFRRARSAATPMSFMASVGLPVAMVSTVMALAVSVMLKPRLAIWP